MGKIEKWEEVRSQSDAIKFADSSGKALVTHETGKYYRIETQHGAVHLVDNCRTMPKCEREQVRFWFWGLGLLSVIAVAFGIARLLGVA
jgi:hypothetical protein